MRVRALLLLAIAAGIHAGPLNFEETQCATTCVPSTKFAYETGSTYRFSYDADTVTSLAGSAEEHSALHVSTTADVHVLSPCELVLTLRDTRLEEYAPRDLTSRVLAWNNVQFRRDLEARSLRFSFQDGRVELLCASQDDEKWVVNFKRGVLTAFQNSMLNLDDDSTVSETDVSGNCEAVYKVENIGMNTVTLTKTKNLLGCTERTGHFSSLQATSYKVPSEVQSLPLLRSSHSCEQTITSGFLIRSECEESHVFRPFAKDESAAQTTVRQSLIYTGVVNTAPSATGSSRRTTMLYEHETRETAHSNDISLVTNVLQEICESTDIRPETPRLFTQLVYNMRKMDVASLSRLHRMVEADRICSTNSQIAKKFFHDAIPATGSESSVALIRDLVMEGELTGDEADLWLSSLAFIPEPTAEMIQQATNLLTRHSRQAYLSVSTLVHTYCKYNTDCDTNRAVQTVLTKIVENLGYNCRANSEDDVERIVISLKALGNTGWSSRAGSTLARCISNTDNTIEVRLAAIEAYRRLPCDQSREELMTLLRTTTEDVELRIASYLAVMQCPITSVISEVKRVLQSEEVNQVGSFIWTHLTNLMETSDPFKQNIRAILEDQTLAKEFNMDARKFSRNYEGSVFFDSINAGARYESNLIWSPESFLPRSAMLNLTVDMFGKSVNLLEIGGRAEGMEQYLEMMFGPKGYFPNSGVNDAINARLASIDQQLRRKIQSDPKASAYMKIFGNELRFWDTDFQQNGEPFNILNFLLMLTQDHQVELTRSMMFLDSEMTVPTVAGFPVKLAVNGTAAVNVKVGGKMDLRRAATLPISLLIDGYLKPSAAVTVSSTMGVDMGAARTGMKLVSTMHTSTQVTGKVELQESQILTASFDAPDTKQEILNVESKFYMIHEDQEREQTMLTETVYEKSACSGDRFMKITGLKLCHDVTIPLSTKSSIVGFPMAASWSLEKTDTHRSYELELRAETSKERKNGNWAYTNVARICFNTPGSQIDRELLVDFTLDQSDMKLNANLKTPWKTAGLDASITATPELMGAFVSVSVDNRQVINTNAELAMQAIPDGMKLTPVLSITTPWYRTISLNGQAKITDGIEADLTLDAFNSPVTLKGAVQLNGNRYVTDLAFTSPVLNSQVSGYTVVKEEMLSTRMEFSYDYNTGPTHRFVVNGKFKDTSTQRAYKYSVNTAITTSEFPELNTELEADVFFSPKHAETNIMFQYGADSNDVNKRIVLNNAADFKGTMETFELDHTWSFKWKGMGINTHGRMTHSHEIANEVKTKNTGLLSYSPGKDINWNVDIQKNSVYPLNVLGDLSLSYPGREMRVSKNVEETSPGVYNTATVIQWQTGRQIRVQSLYTMDGLKHSLRSEIYNPSNQMSVINAAVNLDFRNFDAKLSLDHNGRSYSTALEYNFDLEQMQAGANFDLSLPRRHITMETSGNARPGDYAFTLSTFWDADNDKSKKFVVNSNINLDNGKHEGQLKVIYPGRKVTLLFNQEISGNAYTHHSEVSWTATKSITMDVTSSFATTAAGQRIEGDIQIKTPFFNDIKLNTNYETTATGMNGRLDVDYGQSMAAEFNINKVSDWNNVESYANVHTPFRGWERMRIATTHDFEKPTKTVHLEVSNGANKIEVDATGKALMNGQSVDLATTIAVKSPFSQDIAFEASHKCDGEAMNTALKTSYGSKQVTAGLTMTGTLLDHNGTFTMTTPSRSVREIESNWRCKINGFSDITLNHDIRVNTNKVTYAIVNQFGESHMTTKFNAQTTSPMLRNFDLTTTATFTSTALDGVSTLTLNDRQIYTLNANLKDEGEDCEAKLQLLSTLRGAEDLSIHMYGRQSQTPHVAHAEFKWAPNKVVALDYEGAGINAEWRLTTPFRNLERIVFNMNHNTDNGMTTRAFLEYAPSKRVSFATHVSLLRNATVSFEFSAPCPYFRQVSGSLTHSGYGTTFDHSSRFAFTMDGYPTMTYEADLSMRGETYLVGQAEVVTPCPYFANPKISIDHQLKGREYVTKASANFYPRNEINIESTFQNVDDQLKISGQLDSTIQFMRSLSFGLNHQGTGAMFTGSGHLESRIADYPITYTHNYNLRGIRLATAELQFQTPSIEQMMYKLDHSISGTAINTRTEVQLNPSKKIVLDNKMDFANGFKMETEFTTPFNILQSVNINIDHVQQGEPDQFTCTALLTAQNIKGRYTISSDVTLQSFERARAVISVLDLFTINVDHSFKEGRGTLTAHSVAGVTWGSKTVQLAYNYDYVNEVQSLTFNSPFRGYEEIQLINGLGHPGPVTFTLKYAPQKQIYLEFHTTITNGWRKSWKLETPFASLSNVFIGLDYDIRGWRNLNTSFLIELTRNRRLTTIEGNSEFKLFNLLFSGMAKLNLQSNIPGYSQLSVDSHLNVERTDRSFNGAFTLIYPSNKIEMSARANAKDVTDISGSFSFSGPADVALNFIHKGDLTSFENSAEFLLNGDETKYEGTFNLMRPTSGKFSLTTPYPPMQFHQIEFNFDVAPTAMRANAEWTDGNRKIATTGSFHLNNGVRATFTLETPYTQNIDLSINHQGEAEFQHDSRFAYGRRAFAVSGNFQKQPLKGEINLETPFRLVQKVSVSGSVDPDAVLTFRLNSHSTTLRASVTNDEQFDVKMSIESTFKPIDGTSVEILHRCNFPEFTTKATVNYGSKTMTLDAGLTTSPINGHLKFQSECPYLKDIDITLQHSNSMTQLQFSVDHGSKSEGRFSLDRSRDITGSFQLDIAHLPQLQGSLSHRFTQNALESEIEFIYGSKSIKTEVTFTLDPIDGRIRFTSPCPYLKDVSAELRFDTSNGGYETTLKVNHDRYGQAELQNTLKFAPFEANLQLRTPYVHLRNVAIEMSHNGDLLNFNNRVMVNHNTLGQFVYEGSLRNWNGDFKLTTPIAKFRNVQLTFNHDIPSGNIIACNSNAAVVVNGNELLSGRVNFQLIPIDVTASVTVFGSKTFALTAKDSGSGTWQNFDFKIEAKQNRNTVGSFQTKFDITSGVSGELHTTSRWTKPMDLIFSHTGNLEQFRCRGNLKYDNSDVFNGDVAFDLEPISLAVNLQTNCPVFKSLNGKLNVQGDLSDFEVETEVTMNDKNMVDAAGAITLTQARSRARLNRLRAGTVSLRDISIQLNSEGNADAFTTQMEVSMEGKVISATLEFEQRPLSVKVTATTPFRGYETVGAAYNHRGNWNAFSAHGEVTYKTGKTIELDAGFKNYNKFSVQASLKSPFAEGAIKGKFEHEGNTLTSNMNLEIGSKNYEASVRIEGDFLPNGRIQINTPIRGWQEITLIINHELSGNRITTNARATANGRSIQAQFEGVFTDLTNMEGDLTVTTPFRGFEQFQFSGKHDGDLRSMQTELKAVLPQERIYEGTFMLNTMRGINAELQTNINGLKDVAVEVTFSATEEEFSTTAMVRLDQSQVINAALEAKLTENELSSRVSVTIPFRNAYIQNMSAQMKVTGAPSAFTGNAELNWNDRQLLEATVNANVPTSASMTLKTPYTTDVTFGWTATPKSSGASGTAFIGWSNKRIDLVFDGAMYGQWSALKIAGSVDVTIPCPYVRQMGISMVHEHNEFFFNNKLSTTLNGKQISDHEITINRDSGSVTVNKPFPLSVTYEHRNGAGAFRMETPMKIDMSYSLRGNTGSLTMVKPVPIDVTLTLDWDMCELKMTKPYQIDGSIALSETAGLVKINQPFQCDFSYNFESNDGSLEMKYPYQFSGNYKLGLNEGFLRTRGAIAIDAEYAININGGSLKVEGPYQIEARYSIEGTSGSIDIARPIAIKAEYTLDWNGGSFVMQKPMAIDIRSTLSANSASVVMTSPYRFDATTTFSWNAITFEMQDPIPVDMKTSFSWDGVTFVMQNPMPIDVTASLGINTASVVMTKPIAVDATLTFEWTAMTFMMNKPMPVNVEASLNADGASFTMTAPYRADARLTVSWSEITFIMTNPIRAELQAQLLSNGGSLKFTGPFEMDTSLTFNGFDGSFTMTSPYRVDFSYELDITKGRVEMGSPIEIKFEYDLSDLAGMFSLQGLYNADASYSIGWNGGYIRMNSPYKIDAAYTMDSASASIDIEKPIAVKASYSFDRNGGQFRMEKPLPSEARLILNANDGSLTITGPIDVEARYTWDGESGSVTMVKPIVIQTSFKFTLTEGFVTMQRPYSVDARYSFGETEGFVTMSTPFSVNARYSFQGYTGSAVIQAPYVDASLSTNRRGGSFTMQQPIQVDGSYTLDGNSASFTVQKPFVVRGEAMYDGTSASLSLTKPFNVDMQGSFDGRKATFNMQKPFQVSVEGHLDSDSASINMVKPIMISAQATFDGRRATFEMQRPIQVSVEGQIDSNSASLSMTKPIRVNAEGSFDGTRAIFEMRQPYAMKAQGHFDGQTASFTLDNPVSVAIEGSFNGQTLSVTMRQPFPVTAQASFDGRRGTFTIDKPVPVSVEGTFDGSTVTFTMNQPYTMTAEVYFDWQRATFKLDRPLPISIEGSLGTNIISASMQKPYQMSAEAYFDGRRATFSLDRPIPINLEGTFDGTTATLSMRQPYQLTAQGYFDWEKASFSIDRPIPVSVEGSFDFRTLTFSMRQPMVLSIQAHLDSQSASFIMNGPYAVNAEGSFDGTRVSFTMRQPYPIDISGHYDGRSASIDMNGRYPISAEGSYDGSQASLTMRRPYPVSMTGRLDGRAGSVDIAGAYPLSAEGSFDGTRGSFTMRKPLQVSLAGHLDGHSASIDTDGIVPITAEGSFGASRGTFRMTKPYPVSIEGQYDGASASLDVSGMYSISGRGHFDGHRAGFTMSQPYQMNVEGMFDGSQASFEMDRPYPINLNGQFDGTRGSLNMQQPYPLSAEGHFDGYSVSFSIDKPYPVSFRGSLGDGQGSFVMDSPIAINAHCTYSISESTFTITKPYPISVGYTYGPNRGSFTMTKPFEVEAMYTLTQNGGSINVVKPIAIIASVEYTGNTGRFEMQQPYPIELQFATNDNAGELNMLKPLPMKVDFELLGSLNDMNGKLGVNWNTRKAGSQVQFLFAHKDQSTGMTLDRSGSLKIIMPTRTVGVSASILKSTTILRQTSELIWDDAKDRKISYLIDLKDTSRRLNNVCEGLIRVDTPVRSMEASMRHSDDTVTYNTDVTLKWDASRDANKQVTFSNTLTNARTGQHAFIISSPLMNKDITLTNEWVVKDGNVLYSCRHELSYSVDTRKNLVISTKFSDEGNTRYGNHNYTAYVTVSHQASTIDIELTAHASSTDRSLSTGAFVNYMMSHGNYETLQWYAEVNRVRKTVNMLMNTPFKIASLAGAMTGNQANLVARDESREIRATAELTQNGFDVSAYVDPEDPRYVLSVSGQYVSNNALSLVASHGHLGQLVTDVEVSLDLQDDHLVRSRFYYRPSLLTDIRDAVGSRTVDNQLTASKMSEIRSAIATESSNKAARILAALPDVRPFVTFVSGEIESFGNDAKVVKRAFNRMYWDNEFYMKTIDRSLETAAAVISETMVRVASLMKEGFNKFWTSTARIRNTIAYFLWVYIDNFVDMCAPFIEYCADVIETYAPVVTEMFKEWSRAMEMKYREITTALTAKVMVMGQKAGEVGMAALERFAVFIEPYVTGNIELFNHVNAKIQRSLVVIHAEYDEIMAAIPWDTIESICYTIQDYYMKYQRFTMFIAREMRQIDFLRPIYDAHISLENTILEIASYLTSGIAEVTRVYVMVLEEIHDLIANAYNKFMETEQSVYIREAVRELAEQVHWSYVYLDVEGKVQSVIESTLAFGIELLRVNLEYLTSDWLNLDMDRIIAFAPRDGIIEFQFWIPTELPTFQTIAFSGIDWTEMYNRFMTVLDNWLPDDLNPWDVYYQYTPSTDIGEWIPPFEAIATIAGQHITTFDGRTVEFMGTCTYVLTKDVHDSTFTLLMDYDKKHLTLVSDNKQVEVSFDGKVNVDATPTEAPHEYLNTQITREGDWLIVTNARGFSLECDLLNEMCVFRMSGWYHGKVGGLMGTYTNEHVDDFTMSNGETTTDVQQFASSWEATGNCNSHYNQAHEYTMVEDNASGRVCGALFMSRLSPMRNCFKVVDPRPFLRACVNDVEETGDDRRGVCKVAAAYVAKCQAKHVDVRTPRVCKRTVESVTTPSADVVFVIEQKSCNDDIVSKLDTMSKMIDRAFSDKGLTDNRFGVVGFGGVGVHEREHIQTLAGKVFGTSRDIATIETSMLFAEGGENTDSLRALEMAASYPFRAGASKSIVMVTCNACQEQTVTVKDMERRLIDAGIQLHVLVEHEFSMDSARSQPRTTYLFGIDSSTAYTKSDVSDRDLNGDVNLYRQVLPPSDQCAHMALHTDGSFFNLEKLSMGRVKVQKSFMDVFARRVAKTAQSDSSALLGHPDEEPEIYYQGKTFTRQFDDYMRS